MWVRAYAPAVVVLVLAILIKAVVAPLDANPLAGGVVSVMRWLPIAGLGWALLLAAMASYRIWRWDRGESPACVACSGPLGGEQLGRANRGGAFRRCYACGKAVNHRHYD